MVFYVYECRSLYRDSAVVRWSGDDVETVMRWSGGRELSKGSPAQSASLPFAALAGDRSGFTRKQIPSGMRPNGQERVKQNAHALGPALCRAPAIDGVNPFADTC